MSNYYLGLLITFLEIVNHKVILKVDYFRSKIVIGNLK